MIRITERLSDELRERYEQYVQNQSRDHGGLNTFEITQVLQQDDALRLAEEKAADSVEGIDVDPNTYVTSITKSGDTVTITRTGASNQSLNLSEYAGGGITEGAWQDATVSNPFRDSIGHQKVEYRKIGNMVYVRGVIDCLAGGSMATIMTLPVGSRPATEVLIDIGMATITIGTNGVVTNGSSASYTDQPFNFFFAID